VQFIELRNDILECRVVVVFLRIHDRKNVSILEHLIEKRRHREAR